MLNSIKQKKLYLKNVSGLITIPVIFSGIKNS